MDKMVFIMNTPSDGSKYLSHASILEVKTESDKSEILSAPKQIQTDEVIISTKGKEKQLKETTTEALRKILGKDEVDESAKLKKSEKHFLDKMIAELQEKITELTNRITKLKAIGDEASLEEVKILNVKLVGLNSQLIELISRKLESKKSSV